MQPEPSSAESRGARPQGKPSPPRGALAPRQASPPRDPPPTRDLLNWPVHQRGILDFAERCSPQVTGRGLSHGLAHRAAGLSEALQRIRPPLPPTVRRTEHPNHTARGRPPEAGEQSQDGKVKDERAAQAGPAPTRTPERLSGPAPRPSLCEFPGSPHAPTCCSLEQLKVKVEPVWRVAESSSSFPTHVGILCHQSKQACFLHLHFQAV